MTSFDETESYIFGPARVDPRYQQRNQRHQQFNQNSHPPNQFHNSQHSNQFHNPQHSNQFHNPQHSNQFHNSQHSNQFHNSQHSNRFHNPQHSNQFHNPQHSNQFHNSQHSNQSMGEHSNLGNNNYSQYSRYTPKRNPSVQRRPDCLKSHKNFFSPGDEIRKKIAEETLVILHKGSYHFHNQKVDIREDISRSVNGSEMIEKTRTFPKAVPYKSRRCKYEVTDETTFQTAKRLVEKDDISKSCILNFASATKPGGGFKNGRNAQEESLTRQSALYSSLKKHIFLYENNKQHPRDNNYTDDMIYSPDVPVIRDHTDKLLEKPFHVSVITSPAVNKSAENRTDEKTQNFIMKQRCKKIIQLAIEKGNKAIVLGAYGCGVFGNDPKEVCNHFKSALKDEHLDGHFIKVVFAIKSDNPHIKQPFQETFSENFASL